MFRWFEKQLDAFPMDGLSLPPRGLVAFCRHYTKGCWGWLSIMALLTALIAVMEVSLFGFLGNLVDWLAQEGREGFFTAQSSKLALMGVMVLILLPLAVGVHSLIIHQTLLGNYPMRIRWQMHRYLLGQSLEFFQNEFAGRIGAKLMQSALAVRETLMKLLDVVNYVVIYFIGTLIIAASADIRLMIPFIVWLVYYILLLRFFIPRLRRAAERQADARAQVTGLLVDSYTNISTVKLFSHNSREENYARQAFSVFQDTVHAQMRLITKVSFGVYACNCLLIFVVAATGLVLWSQNAVGVGMVAVAISLSIRINSMAQWIMWEMSALFENIGIVEDGIHTIAQPRAIEDKPDAAALQVKQGHIRFEHVTFHYGKGKGVIEDLNLDIAPGQKVGLVGRSGAGKSTLANLLLRFHDIERGRILIDGQDIAAVRQQSLRAAISMVTQDTALLHRTVAENILYGRPEADETAMMQAVEQAAAMSFVPALRDKEGKIGFAAQVGERGARLSGGQRQRIAIARVMLKDAPILILDEATSALDSEAEQVIQENLLQLMAGKTVLAIAHRLSTIAAMDRLIVMDKGKIIEDGTHEELIAKGGLYADLWQRQQHGTLIT